mgnify:CR=1 FL=1
MTHNIDCLYFAAKGVWTHAVVGLFLAILTGGYILARLPLLRRPHHADALPAQGLDAGVKQFLLLLLMALILAAESALAGDDCPKNFIDQINGEALTDLQKGNLGKACQGHSFEMAGEVDNIGLDSPFKADSPIVVQLTGDKPDGRTYQIFMARESGCDLGKINKRERIVITASFVKFLGFSNKYATGEAGTCRK